ncbi:hypothetical protein [Pseudonocardia sp. D17]|uniref:hypothetical protein n=1 Tax=Pseudonocardia sp. D17 TaxID=882661 RepID=UPI002B3ED6D2|nr:hypothetical protein PSD17_31560 [Pseudonocardia sp. D17]
MADPFGDRGVEGGDPVGHVVHESGTLRLRGRHLGPEKDQLAPSSGDPDVVGGCRQEAAADRVAVDARDGDRPGLADGTFAEAGGLSPGFR